MTKLVRNLLAFSFCLLVISNCSTVHKSIKHGKLDVQTKMSETVFLDPVAEHKKTAFIQIKNTSDKKDLEITSEIKQAIAEKGYQIVTDPDQAQFMIQANILQVGKATEENAFGALEAGYQGAAAGAVIGGLAGQNYQGAGIGLLAGGLIATIADAAVEVVSYSMITDLQISERANGKNSVTESGKMELKQGTSKGHKSSSWEEKTDWKRYQTRIVSVATKTNLKFETALPELKAGLAQSISGIL